MLDNIVDGPTIRPSIRHLPCRAPMELKSENIISLLIQHICTYDLPYPISYYYILRVVLRPLLDIRFGQNLCAIIDIAGTALGTEQVFPKHPRSKIKYYSYSVYSLSKLVEVIKSNSPYPSTRNIHN